MALFDREDNGRRSSETETVIGSSVKMDGKFQGSGSVLVQGRVTGSMKTKEDIHVAEGANIQASLDARNLTISGEVHGNIKASEHLALTETARVYGDVESKTVAIGTGAVLNGKCTMTTDQAGQAPPVETNGNGKSKNTKKLEPTTA